MAGAMKSSSMLLIVVLLFIFVKQGVSIKCWECRSDLDPKCADPFDNSTVALSDCSSDVGKPAMCRKIRQKVAGVWKYFRDCTYVGELGIEGDGRFCLGRTGSYNIFIEYCTCNSKDGCNSALGLCSILLIPLLAGVSTLGYALNLSQYL